MRHTSLIVLVAIMIACGGATPPPRDVGPLLPPVGKGDDTPLVTAPPSTEADAVVPIEDDNPVWGSRLAPVTIVEFSDFQCPFCSRAESTLDALKVEYGREKLRVVYRHEALAFHPNARPAAEAAAAVRALGGDAAFWRFHELVFRHQQNMSPASYEDWAQKSGVNLQAFREAVASSRFSNVVDRDHQAAEKLGVNGTPAFFINGVALVGAQPVEKFEEVIDQELKNARAALDKGVPKDALYRAVALVNFKVAPDEDKPAPPDTTTVWKVPIGTSPARGPATALVTIVEFSDFQCPYCSRAEPTLIALRAQYGDKLRIVWKNEPLPFHVHAVPAAMLALEARAEKGDAGFWDMHDKLYAQQDKLEDSDLQTLAAHSGLDATKVRNAIAQKKFQSVLDADDNLVDDVQASGTPHFFINGRRLVGAQPIDKFVPIIDDEIKKAQLLVSAGLKPEGVYAELIKNGKEPPPPTKTALALQPSAPVRGDANAAVKIVVFSDFECPFCAKAEPTLADLQKTYGSKVKIEWHDMPLGMHPNAHLAAEAARAVFVLKGKDAFWKFHDAMFAQQAGAGVGRPELEREAQSLGVDMTKFRAALDQHTYASSVDSDAKTATSAGVSGTPAFFINGYELSGAQPAAKFRRLIDLSLREQTAGNKP